MRRLEEACKEILAEAWKLNIKGEIAGGNSWLIEKIGDHLRAENGITVNICAFSPRSFKVSE